MISYCIVFILFVTSINFLSGIVLINKSRSPLKSSLFSTIINTSLATEQLTTVYKNGSKKQTNTGIVLVAASPKRSDNNLSKRVLQQYSFPCSAQLNKNQKPVYEVYSESDETSLTYNCNNDDDDDYFQTPFIESTQKLKNAQKERKFFYRPQDLTTVIASLDQFLKPVLNADSYNSRRDPPTNPILSLILSRYGRYIPSATIPRLYSHMTVNNIHNSKPFGQYKYERELHFN